jgi:hypothetical protein
MKTKCPVADCAVMKARSLLMCRTHWRLVPAWLQREVWTYWRNRNLSEWVRAKNKAIEIVRHAEHGDPKLSGGGYRQN